MTQRRLQGKKCAAGIGVAAAVAAFAVGCGSSEDDSVAACVADSTQVRVDDSFCDQNLPGFGRYVMQLPPTEYETVSECCDEDGFEYDTYYPVYSPLIVPNYGQLMPIGNDPRYNFVRAQPDAARPGKYVGFNQTTRVPAASSIGSSTAGRQSQGSTISRGGLGISGGGSKASASGGSSSGS